MTNHKPSCHSKAEGRHSCSTQKKFKEKDEDQLKSHLAKKRKEMVVKKEKQEALLEWPS